MNINRTSNPRIVIVGGGFAGVSLAKQLSKQEVQVVLLDQHNYHNFQPLLYQVSTGGLEPDSIAYPIRKILKDYDNFQFRLAKVLEISPEQNSVITDIGTLKFDYLVIASGSETNYFGNKSIEAHSMAMKTIPQALDLRSLILENFEEALLTTDLDERNALMNFVIVGAGPTGVELAGALAEIKKGILPKDYPDLDTRLAQIHLVQSGNRILKEMSEKASEKAEAFLEDLGVNVWKNLRVSNYDGKIVTTNSDVVFETATMIWAAGVKGANIKGIAGEDLVSRSNRIIVNEFNQLKTYPNIFAIGDVAQIETEAHPYGYPMMAQPAIQQGKQLGYNLERLLANQPMQPFTYKDKGAMATVGRNKAVVDMPNFKFQGVFAWFVWMFVHLFFLIGFRNRMIVFVNWVYNYIRFDREARLIIRPFKKKLKSDS
ncbi:NADH dehydrogenase [Formosa agariphila KMM 3901]|uniref:NADH:ubiquinone reductase (non-electrogenic) n=1 Tax=Formosa agariphila (strain DSM 15362 / KCTC 12365 / LMG 23005 / KMM 3901 / M-2Alg 35-1) TaxID=1347342 RepID=T2KLY1_FORAG|nr:NAD(P)/FAD-dependent oxidoreductase [Formosa agariphila]CDF79436.1 NADH dehydrogenase [Formosa agariphila KMM 3901]